jgi:hypothetical protein
MYILNWFFPGKEDLSISGFSDRKTGSAEIIGKIFCISLWSGKVVTPVDYITTL